ncbi:hypothetical protein QBC45DRAFT_435464 [Copromyces sp. CBS 386.78]|nr:hypothetical protein QBC45DRAFT_435464 [Copromyces sp. CBS 386.78]
MAMWVGVYNDPGPVDVLAEVLDAKVTPKNTTSPFGPVACGASIRIRNSVIQARITEPPDENIDSSCHLELKEYSNTTELTFEEFNIAWDDNNNAKGAIQYAYLAPMQIETQDVERVWLYGLVLRETEAYMHPYEPRFQRAGFFSLLFSELYPYARTSNDDSDNDSNDGLDEHSPNSIDNRPSRPSLEDNNEEDVYKYYK